MADTLLARRRQKDIQRALHRFERLKESMAALKPLCTGEVDSAELQSCADMRDYLEREFRAILQVAFGGEPVSLTEGTE
jgi:hypothetical protein